MARLNNFWQCKISFIWFISGSQLYKSAEHPEFLISEFHSATTMTILPSCSLLACLLFSVQISWSTFHPPISTWLQLILLWCLYHIVFVPNKVFFSFFPFVLFFFLCVRTVRNRVVNRTLFFLVRAYSRIFKSHIVHLWESKKNEQRV